MKTQPGDLKKKTTTDPIELLVREHEEGMKRLAVLQRAAESIRSEGFSAKAFEEIADTIRWMNTSVRHHTQIEEQFLFPMIEPRMRGLAEQVRGEHRDLWDSFSELLGTVRDVEEGRLHGSSILDVVRIAENIVVLLRNHIRRENTVVFPAIRQLLSKEEYQKLEDDLQREL